MSPSQMFFVSFPKNFQNCWDRACVGITFVKCLQWKYFSSRRNVCISYLCQKLCHLYWYVDSSSSPTLELSKVFHLTGAADSLCTGCSATKFKLQTIFESALKILEKYPGKTRQWSSELPAFKLQSLVLSILKIAEIPVIASTVKFLFYSSRC